MHVDLIPVRQAVAIGVGTRCTGTELQFLAILETIEIGITGEWITLQEVDFLGIARAVGIAVDQSRISLVNGDFSAVVESVSVAVGSGRIGPVEHDLGTVRQTVLIGIGLQWIGATLDLIAVNEIISVGIRQVRIGSVDRNLVRIGQTVVVPILRVGCDQAQRLMAGSLPAPAGTGIACDHVQLVAKPCAAATMASDVHRFQSTPGAGLDIERLDPVVSRSGRIDLTTCDQHFRSRGHRDGAGTRGGNVGDCRPRSGNKIVDIRFRDRIGERVRLIGLSTGCDDQLVADQRRLEVIPCIRGIGQYLPLASGRIVLVEPRYRPSRMSVGIATNHVDLAVACHGTGTAAQPVGRHSASLAPDIAAGIEHMDVGDRRFIGITAGQGGAPTM